MKRILVAVAACAVVVACAGGVQTSVPGSTQVSSLSVDQTRQLCRDRQKYLETAFTAAEKKTFGCSLTSLIGGAIAGAFGGPDAGIAACTMAFNDCQASSGSSDGGSSDPCAMVMVESGCTATVSDFNTCYTEQVEALRPYSKGQQCASLASADGGSPTTTKTTTCDKIASSCDHAKTYSW